MAVLEGVQYVARNGQINFDLNDVPFVNPDSGLAQQLVDRCNLSLAEVAQTPANELLKMHGDQVGYSLSDLISPQNSVEEKAVPVEKPVLLPVSSPVMSSARGNLKYIGIMLLAAGVGATAFYGPSHFGADSDRHVTDAVQGVNLTTLRGADADSLRVLRVLRSDEALLKVALGDRLDLPDAVADYLAKGIVRSGDDPVDLLQDFITTLERFRDLKQGSDASAAAISSAAAIGEFPINDVVDFYIALSGQFEERWARDLTVAAATRVPGPEEGLLARKLVSPEEAMEIHGRLARLTDSRDIAALLALPILRGTSTEQTVLRDYNASYAWVPSESQPLVGEGEEPRESAALKVVANLKGHGL